MLKTKGAILKLVTFVLCIFMLVPVVGFASKGQNDTLSSQLLFIPYGSEQETLGVIKESPGIQPEVPLSFFVTESSYGILDTVKKRVVFYSNGKFNKEISLDFTNYPKDVLMLDDSLYVFDEADVYQVYKLSMDGQILQVYTVNIADFDFTKNALKWLSITKNGTVAVVDCAYNEYELDDSTISVKNGVKGISASGKGFFGRVDKDGIMRLVSKEDNKEILLDIDCIFAGAEIIGSDHNGNVYVQVGDRADTSKIIIESTVRKFDKNNNLVGIAKVPLEDSQNSPTRSVYITPAGKIYFMALKKDGVEIKELSLSKFYKSDIKEKEAKQKSIESEAAIATLDVSISAVSNTRQKTNDRAYDINNLSWSYTKNNNNPPTGATSPDWLGTRYGTKKGIPYCWGGFDAIDKSSAPSSWSNFSDAMNKGKFAGNVNCTGSYKAGTAGLDCSGYVGACLGYTWKPSTYDLWDNSRQVTSANLMDSYNNRSGHVLLYLGKLADGTGVTTCESTTTGDDKCKVYSRTYNWLNNGGYQCRTFW